MLRVKLALTSQGQARRHAQDGPVHLHRCRQQRKERLRDPEAEGGGDHAHRCRLQGNARGIDHAQGRPVDVLLARRPQELLHRGRIIRRVWQANADGARGSRRPRRQSRHGLHAASQAMPRPARPEIGADKRRLVHRRGGNQLMRPGATMALAMPARIRRFATLTAVVAALGALLVSTGSAGLRTAHAAAPSIYFLYSMNCTFTIQDDSGKTITSIAPGNYQVDVRTPLAFGTMPNPGPGTDIDRLPGRPAVPAARARGQPLHQHDRRLRIGQGLHRDVPAECDLRRPGLD